MNNSFIRIKALLYTAFIVTTTHAQIIWPTADPLTINASQFVDASTIHYVNRDTIFNFSLRNYKNWLTVGVYSNDYAQSTQAVFQWAANGTGSSGAFWQSRPAITSLNVSNGNGAAIFNSDYLDTNGTASNAGNGQAPAPHFGELWSPVINATGFNDVSVLFQSYYRHYQSSSTNPYWASTYLSWSEDGGVTWKGRIPIEEHEGYGTYDETPNGNSMVIKLPKSVGTSRFRFKFVFDGDYYFWLIDDVRLGVVQNNMRINTTSVALPPAKLPINSLEPIRFMANVVNNGSATAHNVRLTAKVFNTATQTEIFSTTSTLGDLIPDALVENTLLPDAFTPTNMSGAAYDIRYDVAQDETEEFSRDNTLRFNNALSITDSICQNDHLSEVINIVPTADNWAAGQIKSWGVGQYFYVSNGGASPTSTTRISAILADRTITSPRMYRVGLYEWTDANNDGNVQANERQRIAHGETVVSSDPLGAETNFWLADDVTGAHPVILKKNQGYLAMLELIPSNSSQNAWMATADDRGRYSSGAMKTATRLAGQPRYAGIINYNVGDANATWETTLFSDDMGRYAPKVRLWTWTALTAMSFKWD
jgi:hypothetical protein